MAGHDRFVADLRPLFERRKGRAAPALCCHPYDLCTELIARELGVIVTDERGQPLDAPLDVTSDVTWVGYANARHPAIDRAAASAGADAARPAARDARLFDDLGRRSPTDVRQRSRCGRGAVMGPIFLSRAPGRLDVMGGIADYSGRLVLQWPIREATRVALRRRADRMPRDRVARTRRAVARDSTFRSTSSPIARASYDQVRCWFDADPARHWAAYVAGVFHVLAREHGATFPSGATHRRRVGRARRQGRQLVGRARGRDDGSGAGGVAAGRCAPRLRAIRCQQVENLIVGAPCGVMDQMASICGEADSLMALLCQPAEFQGSVALPTELAVWGIDSGIRHAVTGADYGAVRVGAFMGYRILADLAGLRGLARAIARATCASTIRGGADTSPTSAARPSSSSSTRCPGTLNGAGVPRALRRHDRFGDARRSRSRRYAVWKPTAHPIYEHERVSEWAQLLRLGSLAMRLPPRPARRGWAS